MQIMAHLFPPGRLRRRLSYFPPYSIEATRAACPGSGPRPGRRAGRGAGQTDRQTDIDKHGLSRGARTTKIANWSSIYLSIYLSI